MFISAKTITGKVVGIKRHGHTIHGNPTMSAVIRLETIDGTPVSIPVDATVRIQDNSGTVYGIENREYRDNTHEYELTRAGRISRVTPIK